MLGWILVAALIGAAVITITVTFLDKKIAESELQKIGSRKATVRSIVKDPNVTHIKLGALTDEDEEVRVEIDASYVSPDIYEGMVIYS